MALGKKKVTPVPCLIYRLSAIAAPRVVCPWQTQHISPVPWETRTPQYRLIPMVSLDSFYGSWFSFRTWRLLSCSLDSEPTAPNASRWYPWTVHQKVRLYATFERSPKPFWKVPQFLIKQETSCPVHPLGLTTRLVLFFLKSWIIFTFNHLCHFTCVVFDDCKTPSGKYIWHRYDGGTKAINPHLQKSKSHGLWSWVQNICPLL